MFFVNQVRRYSLEGLLVFFSPRYPPRTNAKSRKIFVKRIFVKTAYTPLSPHLNKWRMLSNARYLMNRGTLMIRYLNIFKTLKTGLMFVECLFDPAWSSMWGYHLLS